MPDPTVRIGWRAFYGVDTGPVASPRLVGVGGRRPFQVAPQGNPPPVRHFLFARSTPGGGLRWVFRLSSEARSPEALWCDVAKAGVCHAAAHRCHALPDEQAYSAPLNGGGGVCLDSELSKRRNGGCTSQRSSVETSRPIADMSRTVSWFGVSTPPLGIGAARPVRPGAAGRPTSGEVGCTRSRTEICRLTNSVQVDSGTT
jgi:hypothetical protein